MALKPSRQIIEYELGFFWTTNITNGGSRGGVASLVTAGSGQSMDNSNAVVNYVAEASGAVPIGLLLNDVVNIDQTRMHLNQHKDEVQVGSKVALMKRGVATTNMILGSVAAGDRAYLAESGNLRGTQGINEAPAVGRFLSTVDQNGYAKVHIDLPSTMLAPPLTTSTEPGP